MKDFIDHFSNGENLYRELESGGSRIQKGWRQRLDHAIIIHQDDMSKVYLPSFVVTASSDITRRRYDLKAHVNAVREETFAFSHEQGGGAKNGFSIS